jgi:NADH dehydrogenase
MTRIALTGASGFVGRHLLPRLEQEGHEVRSLYRFSAGAIARPAQVEAVQGDVRRLETVRSLVQDCEVVIHLAASFLAEEEAAETITAGTENVVSASREAGVKRLIYMSCLGADASAESPLYRAKWKAEAYVRGAEESVPFTILRPSLVVGQGDGVTAPLAALIRTLPAVPVPHDDGHRVQPIDVDDLTRCIMTAMSSDGLANTIVSVGGPVYVTLDNLVDLIAGEVGALKPKLRLPSSWLPAVSALLPAVSRPFFSPARLARFRRGVVASPGIVEREFGFEPASFIRRLGQYIT